ncbi:MAG: hypothetical protein KF747_03665 [Nitrospira sp.]|nr:hypothetical protein [Nitrospira sp.]
MIGVVAQSSEWLVVSELFELFKTPWEQAVPGRKYRVILCTDDSYEQVDADVCLVYSSRELHGDRAAGVVVKCASGPTEICWRDATVPIYGNVGLFEPSGRRGILSACGQSIDCRSIQGTRVVRRIGYDLIAEIRALVVEGQPVANASTPSLELHIAVLRDIFLEENITFIEIPPRPFGQDFICCLTHDVDFFGIRHHGFDRTMAGFLYRSSIGSFFDFFKGRRSFSELVRNWCALCSLPFVFAGLLPDLWRPFEDYAKAEPGEQSTFFLVPFKGVPGISLEGTTNAWRATRYQVSDVQAEVRNAVSLGSEIGVHGIDAWRDRDAGEREIREVSVLTGSKSVGIRMHWLYFDACSPKRLEDAGFDYDSTCGFNEAIGYRAGTSQVFRPLGCTTLMELPMSIMDSALFSSGRLSLAPKEALELSRKIVADAKHFGGTVVINWHDRSLAPERLLGRFYQDLLEMVGKGNRVWFAKCGEAVEWFRWRRSIQFRGIRNGPEDYVSNFQISAPRSHSRGAVIHVHGSTVSAHESVDRMFDGTASIECET